MTRHFLRVVCRGLVGVVLFAQLAVAAYACPGLTSSTASMKASTAAIDNDSAGANMPATASRLATDRESMAGPMDPQFGNLCAEHCHHGQQSDQAAAATVPAALLTALYITPPAPESAVARRPAADATSALVAASQPHTILHCCFRI